MTQADGGRSACVCRAVERVQLPHYQGITARPKIARQIANGKSPTQKSVSQKKRPLMEFEWGGAYPGTDSDA